MKRIILLIAAIVSCIPALVAQGGDKKSEITRIKRSDDYLYAEATLGTPEEALSFAESQLDLKIEQYINEQKKLKGASNIVVKNKRSASDQIQLARGDMYRAFIYIKKSDIIAGENVQVISRGEAAAQPAASTVAPIPATQPAAVAKLLEAKKFSELKPLITSLKEQGLISEYTLYSRLTDASGYYLVVSNHAQEVEAVLAPGGQTRKNLTTGGESSLSDFWHGATIAVKLSGK